MFRHFAMIGAAALAVAACNTTDETVAGSSGQGAVVGGVTAVGGAVVGGVQTAGQVVLSPFQPSSYSTSGSYTDVNGVYHRYDRYGYYDANGTHIPYDNVRGAYCARWNTATNTCVWWLTG